VSECDLSGLSISPKAAAGLPPLVQELQEVLGNELVALILYGEAVSHNNALRQGEVALLVVMKDVSTDLLDMIAMPIRRGIREYRLSVMILSQDELHRSTDVFPVKFLSMQRHHRLLCGKDVLQSLEIGIEHLRLRCEQEIKNLMLRLHQWYVLQATMPDQLERTLKRAVVSFLRNLAVLAELKTDTRHHQPEDILRGAHESGLDVEPLRQALALRQGTAQVDAERIKELYNQVMRTVHRAAEIVDAL
jgi:hypothetical protein